MLPNVILGSNRGRVEGGAAWEAFDGGLDGARLISKQGQEEILVLVLLTSPSHYGIGWNKLEASDEEYTRLSAGLGVVCWWLVVAAGWWRRRCLDAMRPLPFLVI